jgi:antitoxin HigA-1
MVLGPFRPTPRSGLARYFGTSERFWLNLQAQYDLDVEYDRIGDRIEKEIRPLAV